MDKQTLILLSFVLIITGCWKKVKEKPEKSDFYTSLGGWDWIRIPLIYPYEAKKSNPENTHNSWSIDFSNSIGTYNVKRISVIDSVIYILSGKIDEKDDSTLVNLRNVETGFYIIDVKNRSELGFSDKAKFESYLREKGYKFPMWHDIDSISTIFLKNHGLPWETKL